ncbi:MAG: DUF4360 domain-containing protein [Myxococcales bacterium]|nr:DUF4360 domain-containing protein [Myxococcales bacterium]
MKTFTAFALTALITSPALATELLPDFSDLASVQITDFIHGGNGCPQGSVVSVLTPDKQTLSILHSEFVAETGASRFDRKSCNLALSVSVPQGITVALIGYDYRGFAAIPRARGSRGMFRSEYFFAGSRGPVSSVNFEAGTLTDFIIEDDFPLEEVVWAPCGRDVNLRSNTSIVTIGSDAYLAVDTLDIDASVVYQLQWKFCDE